MANLMESMAGMLQGDNVSQLAKQFGVDEKTVQSIASVGLPMILGGLNKNVANQQGAEALNTALESHDGGIFSNLTSMLSNNPALLQTGMSILGHVFGGKKDAANQQISQSTGVNTETVVGIMATLAPMVMGFLGKQKKEEGLDVNGIVNVVNTSTQETHPEQMGVIQKFLDQNGDGSISDDLMNIGGKILGSFFGGKK
jgi:hypothetical protein